MNTKQLIVVLILIAGCNCAAAAQNETRRVEKRIVTSANAPAGAPDKAREPVTYLGVAVAPAELVLAAQLRLPEGQGLVVNVVEPDSPAAKAGLQQHDVLTKLDDQILIDPRQLSVLVRNRKEGDGVTITYVRGGAEARATATLATHVPGPEPFFKWIGGEPSGFLFHTEDFGPSAGVELLAPEAADVMHFNQPVPHVTLAPSGAGIRGDRVMFFPPRANLVFSDDAGTMLLRVGEGGQELTAKNPRGEVVFSGPVSTPEQRASLPEDLRRRLEKVEGLDVFEAPAGPGVPGTPAFAPADRVSVSPPVL